MPAYDQYIVTSTMYRVYQEELGLENRPISVARISEGWCPVRTHGPLDAHQVCVQCPDAETIERYGVKGVRWRLVCSDSIEIQIVRTVITTNP